MAKLGSYKCKGESWLGGLPLKLQLRICGVLPCNVSMAHNSVAPESAEPMVDRTHSRLGARQSPIFRRVAAIAFSLFLSVTVFADTTTLTTSDAIKGSSNIPVTIAFAVARSADTSYDTVLSYHTVDGSAVSPLDYTASSSSILITAGSTSSSIPVTIAAYPFAGPDRTFYLVLDKANGIGPAPTFTTPQPFATAEPIQVVVADINGDGKGDLVVANYTSGTVAVMFNTTPLGSATPSFALQQTFPTGSMSPASVAVADVNSDGRPDIVVADFAPNFLPSTVSVLLNTTIAGAATASFAARQSFAVGEGPIFVAAADINGDGLPDLVVANFNGGSVSALINTTAPGALTANFGFLQTFSTGGAPVSVAVADVNADGKPDVIVANGNYAGTVAVLLNTTAPGAPFPSFATRQLFDTSPNPSSVASSDLNGDGRPDLIVATYAGASVLLNETSPGGSSLEFTPEQTFAAGSAPDSVTVADINGDGKPDMLVTNYASATVSVFVNTTAPAATSPSFAAQQSFDGGFAPASVVVSDVNGDGSPDLIIADSSINSVAVLLNTTALGTVASSFPTAQSFPTRLSPNAVTVADVNEDGKPDLIAANFNDNTVSLLLNDTVLGTYPPNFRSQQTFAAGTEPSSVAAGDLNGDGRPDVIVSNYNAASISVLINTTEPGVIAGSFGALQTFATGRQPLSVALVDINGDGKQDVVVANQRDNTVSVLLNTAFPGNTSAFFAAQTTLATGLDPFALTSADVNGDGKPDLIVANTGDRTLSVLLNTTAPGAATPSFATQQVFATVLSPFAVSAADVNGDGKPDLIVVDHADGTVAVSINTTAPGAATATFGAPASFGVGLNPTSVAAEDVDGDGRPDLIVSNNGDNAVSVLINTTAAGAATATFATQNVYGTGTGPQSVATADVNGDGKPDLVVANVNDSTISVLLNAQYMGTIAGSPATGTIVHDLIFADGFE
jgi:hypothetical protein